MSVIDPSARFPCPVVILLFLRESEHNQCASDTKYVLKTPVSQLAKTSGHCCLVWPGCLHIYCTLCFHSPWPPLILTYGAKPKVHAPERRHNCSLMRAAIVALLALCFGASEACAARLSALLFSPSRGSIRSELLLRRSSAVKTPLPAKRSVRFENTVILEPEDKTRTSLGAPRATNKSIAKYLSTFGFHSVCSHRESQVEVQAG